MPTDAWTAGIEAAAREIENAALGPAASQNYDLSARMTRAFLREIEARGWRVVPVEPDTDMISDGNYAAINARRSGVCGMTIDAQVRSAGAREVAVWFAMLAAAPRIEGEG